MPTHQTVDLNWKHNFGGQTWVGMKESRATSASRLSPAE